MKTLDYRVTSWGHNHTLTQTSPGIFEGFVWHYSFPEAGDEVLWLTNYGHAVAEIASVKAMMDPSDMYLITAKVIGRVADEAIVSQEELDNYYKEQDA